MDRQHKAKRQSHKAKDKVFLKQHFEICFFLITLCCMCIQRSQAKIRWLQWVVSIGLFWFYFVSFSYNGEYFLRLFFNRMLVQYQGCTLSIFAQRCMFVHREQVKLLSCPKKCSFPSPLEPFWLTMMEIVWKQTNWERNNPMEATQCTNFYKYISLWAKQFT